MGEYPTVHLSMDAEWEDSPGPRAFKAIGEFFRGYAGARKV
jgi:hypothetical protein